MGTVWRWLPRGLVLVGADGEPLLRWGRGLRSSEPSAEPVRDRLTGLSTRSALVQAVERELARAERGEVRSPAFALLDLDGLRTVNEHHGHGAGDEVLMEVAARIGSAVRDGDLVARVGGDEFAVLLPGATLDEVGPILDRVLARVEEPVVTTAGTVRVSASIGVAQAPPPVSASELLSWTDHAMYYAKSTGGGRVQVARRGIFEALAEERRRLNRAAMTDPRTRLGNVRAYELALEGIHRRAVEDGEAYAAVLMDLDHFHVYNRVHSLADGDVALETVAGLLSGLVGEGRAFRYGGEEFVALVRADEARDVADRLVVGVRALGLVHPGRDDGVDRLTVTVGVARWRPGDPADAPVRRADRAAVVGKLAGRDRVVDADEPGAMVEAVDGGAGRGSREAPGGGASREGLEVRGPDQVT